MDISMKSIDITAVVAACAAMVPAGGEPWTAVKEFGPWVGLVLWFAWRDWRREERMAKRISGLEGRQYNESSTRITACIEAMARSSAAMEKFAEKLDVRPCMRKKIFDEK